MQADVISVIVYTDNSLIYCILTDAKGRKLCSGGGKKPNKTRNVGIWHSGRRHMCSKGMDVNIKCPTRTITTMFGVGFKRKYFNRI